MAENEPSRMMSNMSEEDMDKVIISPEECSTQGGEVLSVTFPHSLPLDPILVFLYGSTLTHKLSANRTNDNTITVTLPAHKPAEVVDIAIYQIPDPPQDSVDDLAFQPCLLLEDKILYTDLSSYLAELLVQSVTDGSQGFYSMLPPLTSLDEGTFREFDLQLSDALKEVELPNGWSLMKSIGDDKKGDTLLHFAARNGLSCLFSLLLSLPGGRRAVKIKNSQQHTPLDLARISNSHDIISDIESINSSLLTPHPSLRRRSQIDPLLQLLIDLNGEWIIRHSKGEGDLLSLPRAPTPHQLNVSSITYIRSNPNSLPLTKEDSPSSVVMGDDLFHACLSRSWSRVVGSGWSRSVDTGLNELSRASAAVTSMELQHQRFINKKEVCLNGWSISTPVLCDNAVSDLVHSAITSPSIFENSAFLSDFTPPTTLSLSHAHSSTSPHKLLGNQDCHFSLLPMVCVENPNSQRVCMTPPLMLDHTHQLTPTEQHDDTFLLNLAHLADSSGDDEGEENHKVKATCPLISKSVPALSCQSSNHLTSSSEVLLDKTETKEDEVLSVGSHDDAPPAPSNLDLIKQSQVSTTPSSPVTTPVQRKRGHKKSYSLPGVVLDFENEELMMSHTSSFVSTTSSKQESSTTTTATSSDVEEDEEREKVSSAVEGSRENKMLDLVDGGRAGMVGGATGRRYSAANIVTNIDDELSSGEESNQDDTLKRREKDKGSPDRHSNEGLALSDIELKLDASNSSKSSLKIENSPDKSRRISSPQMIRKSDIAPLTIPPLVSRSTTISLPPTHLDARQTIQALKFLTIQEQTGIKQRPLLERSTTPINHTPTDSPRLHNKVARNNSSVSDNGVVYQSRPCGTSSLDFVQSPDNKTSPRTGMPFFGGGEAVSPSQLINRQVSPKLEESNRGDSPITPTSLDKKARSVDDLLVKEGTTNDEKQIEKSDESPIIKHNVRFHDNSSSSRPMDSQQQRKDLHSYLGITDHSVEGKETKNKSNFKLFRRDSKKEKKVKKVDSTGSLESSSATSLSGNHDDKSKKTPPTRHTPVMGNSPVVVKARANTIHVDANVPLTQTTIDPPPPAPLLPLQSSNLPTEIDNKQPDNEKEKEEKNQSTSPPLRSPSAPSEVSILSPEVEHTLDDSSVLSFSIDEQSLLGYEEEDTTWYRTIDRRLRRSINKHEKGRQGAIFDWIRTEKHIYRALLILKLFKDKMSSELHITEDVLDQMFPNLGLLLEVTKEFSSKLERRQRQSSMMIEDVSDILMEQFTGERGERMKLAYTGFICRQTEALELYRDYERKRQKFARLMTGLYQHKICERRKLSDFFLLITQRVAKYVEMMKKLLKETEVLKLEHLNRLKLCSMALEKLVQSVDQGVEEYENRKTLESIQSRLEIQPSRQNSKIKGLKSLDLLAQNRRLIKFGEGQLQGGKSTAVHIVLVTDLVVLLTERDQKYHLATLHDVKEPPIIKLFYLHVRLDASIRSGVQLILIERGDNPKMFKIEFSTKKEAKGWEEALNKAAEHCKQNGLKCGKSQDCFTLSHDLVLMSHDLSHDLVLMSHVYHMIWS
jgi:hypothetical protein